MIIGVGIDMIEVDRVLEKVVGKDVLPEKVEAPGVKQELERAREGRHGRSG